MIMRTTLCEYIWIEVYTEGKTGLSLVTLNRSSNIELFMYGAKHRAITDHLPPRSISRFSSSENRNLYEMCVCDMNELMMSRFEAIIVDFFVLIIIDWNFIYK